MYIMNVVLLHIVHCASSSLKGPTCLWVHQRQTCNTQGLKHCSLQVAASATHQPKIMWTGPGMANERAAMERQQQKLRQGSSGPPARHARFGGLFVRRYNAEDRGSVMRSNPLASHLPALPELKKTSKTMVDIGLLIHARLSACIYTHWYCISTVHLLPNVGKHQYGPCSTPIQKVIASSCSAAALIEQPVQVQ